MTISKNIAEMLAKPIQLLPKATVVKSLKPFVEDCRLAVLCVKCHSPLPMNESLQCIDDMVLDNGLPPECAACVAGPYSFCREQSPPPGNCGQDGALGVPLELVVKSIVDMVKKPSLRGLIRQYMKEHDIEVPPEIFVQSPPPGCCGKDDELDTEGADDVQPTVILGAE